MKKQIPLTEPMAVADVFASGLAEVERLSGGCYRFTLFAEQRGVYTGAPERVVVARIVMPAGAIPTAILMVLDAVGLQATDLGDGIRELALN